MDPAALGRLDVCDSLYLSPRLEDALLACAARLTREHERGRRVLFVTLFERSAPLGSEGRRVLDVLRASDIGLDLPGARQRSGDYASFRALAFGHRPDDQAAVVKAVHALARIGDVARPREVYAPLGVGGHVDHRLTHDAALAAFESRDDRNVFLYEERPEAVVSGAVRIRLGLIGARLPPAASDSVAATGLLRFLRRFHLPHAWRGDLVSLLERLRAARLAARAWRESRRWRSHKGLGPRIQPVIHVPAPGAHESILELRAAACEVAGRREPGEPLRGMAAAYCRLLGGPLAERYWLLLPRRDADGHVAPPLAEAREGPLVSL
jgi:hypothetical protein